MAEASKTQTITKTIGLILGPLLFLYIIFFTDIESGKP